MNPQQIKEFVLAATRPYIDEVAQIQTDIVRVNSS